MSEEAVEPGAKAEAAAPPALRVRARPDAPPLGAIFGGIGLVAAVAVWTLRLDRIPLTFCVFKGLTGLPCPTCGSTRALGRLAAGDLAGAFAMNPATALGALGLVLWALVDLALLPSHRALSVEVSTRLGRVLKVGFVLLVLASWAWLLAAGR